MPMDRELADRLNNLNAQNDRMKQAEGEYRFKEAERKSFEAGLILSSTGKSHAEKSTQAQADQRWHEFQTDLAQLETEFNFQRRRYDILMNAFYAELNTFKREDELIKKGAS